ncbi:hypothetical protein U9M48_012658 [Paspalum notatum var. saurae]|uniref:Aminotransferase-like plant mobile domain-containing protein n=1 Tax=Paspalum notatum var. saurae TaxID=547442 RepID=A0AAQ3T043_PASNO
MLDLARLVNSGLPPLDPALLTALVDRWRPETHTLEMTITLEDTAMILVLSMNVRPQCVAGSSSGFVWYSTTGACGKGPCHLINVNCTVHCRKTSGVTTGWLRQHFGVCPADAGPAVVERHARAWLWYLLACFLLPILDQPWAAIATYSWAFCTLGHMYRQLCDGCQRREKSSSIGGCLYLLQEWAFEDSRPTALWFWRDMEVVTSQIDGRYKHYMNEQDCITHRQVEWMMYSRHEIKEAELSPLCNRDEDLWRAIVPLIYFVVVEYHIPTCVLCQFGQRQVVPPHTVPTDPSFHRKKRQGRFSKTDWRITHIVHTGRWDARQRLLVEHGEAHDKAYFVEYLRWLQEHTRVRLRPTADHRPISEVDSDEIDKLSRKIGCYNVAALPPQPCSVSGGLSAGRGRSSQSSRSREVTRRPLEDEDEDEDEDGEDDEDDSDDGDDGGARGPEVLSSSQLVDTPLQFTQTHDHEAISI